MASKGRLVNWAISEHIENAGVHSGDATVVLPAISIPEDIQEQIRTTSEKIATALEVSGPVNIQYLYKDGKVSVIECNLRASRSFPFVSKVLGVDFLKTATKVFLGEEVPVEQKCFNKVDHYGVKAAQFSFQRLAGSDPVLGVEMASTGEVACFGRTPEEAFLKAILSSNFKWPHRKTVLLSNIDESFVNSAKTLQSEDFQIFATPESSPLLAGAGVSHSVLPLQSVRASEGVSHSPKGSSGEELSALDFVQQKKIDFVINFPIGLDDPFYPLRRKTVDFGVSLVTDPQVAKMLVTSLASVRDLSNLGIEHHQNYFGQ